MKFDAKAEAIRLKTKTDLYRKKRFSRSKLDMWKAEIQALRSEGSTLQAIQLWLKEHKTPCQPSTISRWLKRHG